MYHYCFYTLFQGSVFPLHVHFTECHNYSTSAWAKRCHTSTTLILADVLSAPLIITPHAFSNHPRSAKRLKKKSVLCGFSPRCGEVKCFLRCCCCSSCQGLNLNAAAQPLWRSIPVVVVVVHPAALTVIFSPNTLAHWHQNMSVFAS